jgi:hypothetical protein
VSALNWLSFVGQRKEEPVNSGGWVVQQLRVQLSEGLPDEYSMNLLWFSLLINQTRKVNTLVVNTMSRSRCRVSTLWDRGSIECDRSVTIVSNERRRSGRGRGRRSEERRSGRWTVGDERIGEDWYGDGWMARCRGSGGEGAAWWSCVERLKGWKVERLKSSRGWEIERWWR